jgi:regulatory protein
MKNYAAQGEGDAIIIPFPLHRVSSPVETQREDHSAAVQELPVIPAPRDTGEESAQSLAFGANETTPLPDAERRAHNVSLHALAGRDMSRYEVEAKLRQRELPRDVIEAEVESLISQGLINDEALAYDLVDRYAHRGGMAKPVVAQKLRQRHLDPVSIEQALSELDDDVEASKLDDLARDRLRKMGDLDAATTKRRLAGFLQRKGFSSSEVFSTLDRVLNSRDSE